MFPSENPLITIAIPTFNRANGFLRQALQSAVSQTYTNLEIIVSDNCSTDNTGGLVDSFSDSRIIYYKQAENIGANNNFNFCVQQAKGAFFLLLNDDDTIDNDFLETCVASLGGNLDVGVIFAGNRVIDENSKVLYETPNKCQGLSAEDFFISWFEEKVAFYLCSTLFNTKKLQRHGGFNSKTNLFQDVVAETILAWNYGRIDVFDAKASFRRHSDNKGGKPETVKAWCEDCLYLMNIICDLAVAKKDMLRQKGIKYFATKNYRLASSISSPTERIRTYYMINRKYHSSYTPYEFLYEKNIRPFGNKLKRTIKNVLLNFNNCKD